MAGGEPSCWVIGVFLDHHFKCIPKLLPAQYAACIAYAFNAALPVTVPGALYSITALYGQYTGLHKQKHF